MKTFFLTVLSLYLAANVYVSISTWHLLPAIPLLRITAIAVIIFGILSPIIFFTFGETLPLSLSGILYKIGTSWMIAFLYIFLMFLFIDIFKLFNHLFHFTDKESIRNIFRENGLTAMVGFGAVAVLLILGNINYHNKKRVHIKVESDKVSQPVKIIGISDLHLGYTIGRKELAKWVKIINSENPDMVLIAGDLIDNQLRQLNLQAMDRELVKLNAPLGVYACTGNHEYISGIKESSRFFEKSNITLLRDTSVTVGQLTIIGREDISYKNRKPLTEVMKDADLSRFTILLDHQPYNLNDAVENKIDFQLSGHTHRGQIFPASLLVKFMFELPYGFKQKDNTRFYVTSGLGIWGGKFRIGTRSEYVVLEVLPE